MASSSHADDDVRMSSSSDSDYEPVEEEDQSEGEDLTQAYLERLLAGELGEEDEEAEEDDGERDDAGGATHIQMHHIPR